MQPEKKNLSKDDRIINLHSLVRDRGQETVDLYFMLE